MPDSVAASYADRVVFLADGQIVDEMLEPTPERVLDRLAEGSTLQNVLTGETGAGKSIIVGALSLLLGERAVLHEGGAEHGEAASSQLEWHVQHREALGPGVAPSGSPGPGGRCGTRRG